LQPDERRPLAIVASAWSKGELIARDVLHEAGDPSPLVDAALASHPEATRVQEAIVAEGPVLAWAEPLLAVSLVPGRDGLAATLGARTEYVTPDDLLARQAYDKGVTVAQLQVTMGVDVPVALALLSQRLDTTARELLDHGRLRRIRVVRSIPGPSDPRATSREAVRPETLTDDEVRDFAVSAGRYLARGVDAQGRFRYIVDAPTNRTLPGYDWPRHAGATYFLAQSARLAGDPNLAWAALRAGGWLRDHALLPCGSNRCIGDSNVVDVGSTALAVLAFVEIATHSDPAYRLAVPPLAAFLRAQQRPDGEFMHLYDRAASKPIDVQLLYYSGEAAFALSRAHGLLGDPNDLDAATRALAHLVGSGWSFFGSRYYWGEEHWTCQAMDDLWDRAPSPAALDFCLRWHAFGRKLQYGLGDTLLDAEGAYGFGPLLTPRLTPAGSRTEAAIATLDAAVRSGRTDPDLAALQQQIRRSLALLVRQQFRFPDGGTRSHLLVDPASVDGGVPGSEVDWQLRIDYAQHSGSAMIRWLERADGKARK
jgi:hypothetical protein